MAPSDRLGLQDGRFGISCLLELSLELVSFYTESLYVRLDVLHVPLDSQKNALQIVSLLRHAH